MVMAGTSAGDIEAWRYQPLRGGKWSISQPEECHGVMAPTCSCPASSTLEMVHDGTKVFSDRGS